MHSKGIQRLRFPSPGGDRSTPKFANETKNKGTRPQQSEGKSEQGGGYRVGGLFKNLCATLFLDPPTAGGVGRRRVIFTAGVAGGDEGDSLLQASAACSVKAGGGGRSSLLDGDGAAATG